MTTIHLRDEARPHMSLCGLGYDYPSTIPLAREGEEATCRRCLERRSASVQVDITADADKFVESLGLEAEIEKAEVSMTVEEAREIWEQQSDEDADPIRVEAAKRVLTAAGWE
jgi:hypothetical protein